MPKITTIHSPNCNAQLLKKILEKRFIPLGYEVEYSKLHTSDVHVKTSEWIATNLKISQTKDSTEFIVNNCIPNPVYRLLATGLLSYLVLNTKWKVLEEEITDYLKSENFVKKLATEKITNPIN